MSKQVLIQLRIEESMKAEVTKIFDSLGLDFPTALRMFLARCIIERGLPFEVKMPEQASDVSKMNVDKHNPEITAIRVKGKAKRKG